MRVDFMIIGAQKCGTTTLYEILAGHPSLSPCRPKEPAFFSSTKDWRANIDSYHEQFDPQPGQLTFEGSTMATGFPHEANQQVWKDLHDYNPELKFIYMVRHPIERMISSFMHMLQQDIEKEKDIVRALETNSYYLDLTKYHSQITPFIEVFGSDRILILEFEEFVKSRTEVLKQTSDFLGINFEDFQNFETAHWNSTIGPAKKKIQHADPNLILKSVKKFAPPIWNRLSDNSAREYQEKMTLPENIQKKLIGILKPEITGMEKLLNRNFEEWRKPRIQKQDKST